MRALFKALAFPRFALLWGSQTLSRAGDAMYRVALAWWVLEKTGSAAAVGKLFILSFSPTVVFLLVGGVVVDRFPRGRVMLVSDVARGVVVMAVSLLAFRGLLELWHVYAATVIFGTVSAFFQPSYTAIIPEIVSEESLASANSLTGLSRQGADVAGPALGASLVALGGPAVVFAANGASFLISAACLLPLLRLAPLARRPKASAGLLGDVKEGVGAVLARPWLWVTIGIAAVSNITVGGPVIVAMPFLVKEHLRADVGALGFTYSMLALGSVVATVWVGRHARLRRRGLVAYGAWLVIGLMVFLFGVAPSLAWVWAAAFVFGAALAVFTLIWVRTLQEFVPPELLGRVSSIDTLGSSALLPVGYGVVGWATDQVGPSAVFMAGGVVSVVLAALGLTHREIRNLD